EVYDNEVGNYRGNVDLKRADQQASSNAANYDSVSEALDLHGNVFYSEDELALYTESANLKLASDEARMRDTLFISPTTPIRGKASAVYRDSEYLNRYKEAAYTSCEPGNQDWIVHATDLKMNKKTGEGSAKNAWLEFKGVPVFYSPYLNFPIDSRRKSGFLAPSFGNTQRGGFNFSAPFYWNIAPNYDATIRPRYYTKRGEGPLLAADFRYLTQKSKGLVSGEFLSQDTINDRLNSREPTQVKDRYLATFKNNTRFTKNLSANVDLNIVSDYLYFSDLGNALSFPNFSHIRSFADMSYIDKGISLTGIVENFQTIDPTLSRLGGRLKPYRRLPQLNLNFDHAFESFPAVTGLENEFVYFQHSDSRLPDGQRFNIKPYVSFPLKATSAFVTPKLALQYTQYLLDNQQVGTSESIGRIVPTASIDSGVFLEKDVNLLGGSYLHTIEPRLFYLYIPKVNQSDIPIFDTSLYDFQYDSLFRENRFNSADRIQDANQITAAFSSRLVDSETGLEKLKLNVGQAFYIQRPEVTGPVVRVGTDFLDNAIQPTSFSPLVAELSSQINKHLSVQSGLQWDPNENEIVRGNASVHIVNDPGEVLNLGYTYRKSYLIRDALDSALADNTLPDEDRVRLQSFRDSNPTLRSNDIIQSDISLRWPVYDNWFLVGRWQYSLLFNQTQDAFVGFEKENCCWRFRVIGRQFINNLITANNLSSQSSNTQTGIFFQIEFKGLTSIGNAGDIGDFFSQSISGYQKKDY
ncbi:partial LPS-assembly protein LptD, partial [biofilm metagenome]